MRACHIHFALKEIIIYETKSSSLDRVYALTCLTQRKIILHTYHINCLFYFYIFKNWEWEGLLFWCIFLKEQVINNTCIMTFGTIDVASMPQLSITI